MTRLQNSLFCLFLAFLFTSACFFYLLEIKVNVTLKVDNLEEVVEIFEKLSIQDSPPIVSPAPPQVAPELLSDIYEEAFHNICPRSDAKVAIVVPFIHTHMALLEENLRTWAQYFPCSNTFAQEYFGDSASLFENKVQLYFYFNNAFMDEVESTLNRVWQEIKDSKPNNDDSHVPLQSCFAGTPGIIWANLNEEQHNHLTGTSMQFTKIFDILDSQDVDYFYLMEPDTWPIRSNWVEKIFLEAVCGEDFWIKGSTFRNARIWHLRAVGDHWNGNALYNTKDKEFVSWVKDIIQKHPGTAYDVLIGAQLRNNTDLYRDRIHKFHHVDWIYNYGNRGDVRPWRPWSAEHLNTASPNTYLVHGKKR